MKKLFILCFIVFLNFGFTQQTVPGQDFFGTNQVVRVDFTFNQTGFWDSLVQNYQADEYMMAIGMTITDLQGAHIKDSVAIKLKGNSSYGHPGTKKSFKIDINKYNKGSDYDGLKMLNFNNCFKDPSFMREKIYFDLCKAIGVPAPRVNYANVYMNGQFWGFYNVVEQIDDQFLDYCIFDDNGNLFKAGDNTGGNTPADLKYYGNTATSYYDRYELKTNEDINDWSDLISLITWINNGNSTDFVNNFGVKINKQKYLRSMALDNLFANLDSYLNSARNYYIYHNLTTNLWEWIKWDGNESFGQYPAGQGVTNLIELEPNYIAPSRPLMQNILSNTQTYQEYIDEYCYLKNIYFNSTYMNSRIDSIKTLIESHVVADNKKMYNTQNFYDNIENNITVSGGPGGNQTIYGLKSFITERSAFLQNISCQVGLEDKNILKSIYPNVFEDLVYFPSDFKLINISDVQGKHIDYKFTNQSEILNNVSLNVKQGIYFFTFEYKKNKYTVRLIKQ